MLAEDDVVEDTASTKDVTDRLRLGRHILDVNDLGSNITRSSTSYKEVVRVIGNSSKSEIDDDWLFAEDDVVRLQITMDHVLSCHLS